MALVHVMMYSGKGTSCLRCLCVTGRYLVGGKNFESASNGTVANHAAVWSHRCHAGL